MGKWASLEQAIYDVLKSSPTPVHLQQIYSGVKQRLPDLCDDSIRCPFKGCNGRHPKWQHETAWAVQILKAKNGLIESAGRGYWKISKAPEKPTELPLPKEPEELLPISPMLHDEMKQMLYEIGQMEGKVPVLSKEETKNFEEALKNNPGLDSYLQESPGKELLVLSDDAFNELVYYTSITREKKKAEIAQDVIDEVLGELTEREHRVIQLRFGMLDGIPRTLQEVGREFDLTGERIRQIESIALRRLRHPIRSRRLRRFLSSMDKLDYSSRSFLMAIFGSDWQSYMPSE